MAVKYYGVSIVVIILLCGFYYSCNNQRGSIKQNIQNEILNVTKPVKENANREVSILDVCYDIYLDVASNIGIQAKKLFEPEIYSGAKALPIYDAPLRNIDSTKKEYHANGKRFTL